MSYTVHVGDISHATTEKEVRDFFSFCGKITNLSMTPTSASAEAPQSATVTFEKETAAKTALLLDNTQLGKSQVKVTSASTIDQVATQAGAAVTSGAGAADEHHISQDDKPRSRVVAEYLASGYQISDKMIENALALDKKHGISTRFTNALQNFDNKYKATDKARGVDEQYQVTNKAYGAWAGLNSYFEKALGTPTGQKIRSFYVEGDRQIRDVHEEARRLADLKAGKVHEPHPVPGEEHATSCSCGGEDAVCGCAPGQCRCSSCPRNEKNAGQGTQHAAQTLKGTEKTVCSCGGKDGVCGCAPGKCGCASCGKSDPASVTEVKEAAQSYSQTLPKETFGTNV